VKKKAGSQSPRLFSWEQTLLLTNPGKRSKHPRYREKNRLGERSVPDENASDATIVAAINEETVRKEVTKWHQIWKRDFTRN
jgi:hypothetical protein